MWFVAFRFGGCVRVLGEGDSFVEGELVEGEELLDGAFLVLLAESAVAAEDLADLAVDPAL